MHGRILYFPFASLLLVPSLAAPTAQADDLGSNKDTTAGAGGEVDIANSAPAEDPLTAQCLDSVGDNLNPACWNALSVNTYLESNLPNDCPSAIAWAQCFVNQRVEGANYDFTTLPPEGYYYPPPEIRTSPPDDAQAVYGDLSIWFLHHYLSRVADEIRSGGIAPSEGQTIVDAKTLSSALDSDQAPGAADPQLRELGKRVAFIVSALDVATGVETDGLDFLQRVLNDAAGGPNNGPQGAFQRLSADGGLIHSPLVPATI
ncbi:MAG: hypothetical protein Q9183_003594 [Haloplaca sp. 2 TL-2023]